MRLAASLLFLSTASLAPAALAQSPTQPTAPRPTAPTAAPQPTAPTAAPTAAPPAAAAPPTPYPLYQPFQPYPQQPGAAPYGYPYGYPPGPYPYAYPPAQSRGPEELAYKEGAPVPAGYHVAQLRRGGLVMGGIITFASSYGPMLLISALAEKEQARPLAYPFVGPFLVASDTDADGFFVLTGLAQITGGILFGAGMLFTRTALVRDDTASNPWYIAPTFHAQNRGLTAGRAFLSHAQTPISSPAVALAPVARLLG